MSQDTVVSTATPPPSAEVDAVPSSISEIGTHVSRRFVECFAATIHNSNTRAAYARAVTDFVLWCEARGMRDLNGIESPVVARYAEHLTSVRAPATVKQHLTAIRMLFDWLVVGQIMTHNPAASIRGPRHVVRRGKAPVLSVEEARTILDGISVIYVRRTRTGTTITKPDIAGLRDRAIIAVMIYSFARVGVVGAMTVKDYYRQGRRAWFRLYGKGGKCREVPVHHKAQEYLNAYLTAAGIEDDDNGPLFRSTHGTKLTSRPLSRSDIYYMIRRRVRKIGLSAPISAETFRATGITAYLKNGGLLEHAQQIAAHESPRTTKLYDSTPDQITLDDEIDRISI